MLNNETRNKPLGPRDYFGWSIWAIGMLFEVIADYQKSVFKNDPKNEVNYDINCMYWTDLTLSNMIRI